ncbi:MAG TPA: AbrB/MazE/SpoVT family DNA-binding domain-containing protein [Acetobacteraceae bacterium]|nr:AbrB/MazE/SpoVT family DNA-binding domain-containing protein [Acetobacteraceae bacterium]
MSKATLTVTAKGQVTLRREILDHLGVKPGDRITVDLLPDHKAEIRPMPRRNIEALFGSLPSNGVSLSIEEMNEIIERGWAGECE